MNTTQQAAALAFGTTQPCELHKYHAPHDTYRELHHIIPRDWQAVWQPTGDQPYRKYVDGKWLWDGRTVSICRTGHGNVHFYLVKLMHWIEQHDEFESNPMPAYYALREANVGAIDTYALTTAMTGLGRFIDLAHNLVPLFAAHAWGQI